MVYLQVYCTVCMRQNYLSSPSCIILALKTQFISHIFQPGARLPQGVFYHLLCWYLCVGDDAAPPGEGEEPSDGDEEQQEGGDYIGDEQDGEEKPPSPVSSKQ